MSRFKYQSYATDGNGSVITGATISIYLTGTTTVASVYAASSGGVAVNSVTSNATTGYYSFWVDDSDYTGEQFFRIKITKASFGTVTLDDIEVLPLMYAGTGTTAARPTVTTVGMYYIDTTLSQTVFWTGSAWTFFTLFADPAPKIAANLDLNGKGLIYTGTTAVTAAEIGHLDTVSSNIQTQLNATVKDTGNETIAGVKTFSSSPVVPAPTTDLQASTKKYVDDSITDSITLSTPQDSTSGTSIDFTAIPSGTKRITVMFNGVSTSGTSDLVVQIGDVGGIETADYDGVTISASGAATIAHSASFIFMNTVSAAIYQGVMTLVLENASSFHWNETSQCTNGVTELYNGTGGKSLSAELDRIRITTVTGSDTFDAGEINISYE